MPKRDDDELEDEFVARVRRQAKRIEKARGHDGQSLWRYVGLVGSIGWSVVIPMIIGGLLGRWMDLKFETGYVWSLGLFLLGLVIGALNAWRTVERDM